MPVTIYTTEPDWPEDDELHAALKRLREATGDDGWHIRSRRVPATWPWQSDDVKHELLLYIAGGQYQLMQCADTKEKIIAYSFGACAGSE